MTIVEALFSLFLAGIFLISAIPKLRYPKGFVLIVLEYRVLPLSVGKLYGWLLPPVEFFLGLLLLSGVVTGVVASILALLLFSFVIAVGLNLARGRDLDCGCFGTKKHRKIGWGLLLQDILLLVIALALPFLGATWNGLDPWSVFRLFSLAGFQILLPLFVCLCATMCSSIVFRKSIQKRKAIF